MNYRFLFKCQLCGEMYLHPTYQIDAKPTGEGFCQSELHECADGNLGIATRVGFREEAPND